MAPHPLFNEEPLTTYATGGFHPVSLGDILGSGRYTILRKIGWGHYSTVWLAKDEREDRFVALKILMAEFSRMTPEVDILTKARDADPSHPGWTHIVTLYDYFQHIGPNGTHDCLVFELLGHTLEALRLQQERQHDGRRLPIPVVKCAVKQLLLGLDYLHTACGIIHTDLKPSNIILSVAGAQFIAKNLDEYPHEEIQVFENITLGKVIIYKSQPLPLPVSDTNTISIKIADFGTANWVGNHFLDLIQPVALRAPEVILGASWDTSVDIWNTACLLFELITGKQMFGPWPDVEGYPQVDVHLCQIMGLLGSLPKDVLDAGQYSSEYFDEAGKLRKIKSFVPTTIDKLLREHKVPEEEVLDLSSFLGEMLVLRPSDRATARRLLEHPWIRDI